MGRFLPTVAPSLVTDDNPMGTDGFEFVEFAHPEPEKLGELFQLMGFIPVARHRSKNVTLYRQGDVNYMLNAEPDSAAAAFAQAHGPSACAMGFRVADAAHAFLRAMTLGAKPVAGRVGPAELNIPAIEGVGGASSISSTAMATEGRSGTSTSPERAARSAPRRRRAHPYRPSDA